VAYIELGKEYGLVALGVAKGFSYSAYEEFKQLRQSYNDQSAAYDKELGAYEAKLEAYNAAIQDYNRKVAMHNSAPTEAAYQKLVADGKELDKNKADLTILKDKLDAMQEQLMSLANSLGPLSEQKGIVTNVYVHF
jgi:predicted  nucleic acid-binding Zn-ribbon protein